MYQSEAIPEISPRELKERLERGDPITLLDVREPQEWEVGNLAELGARLCPRSEFYDWVEELDRKADIVVYCRSGNRSAWVARDLLEAGFGRVKSLTGGILAWSEEVDREPGEK